MREGAQAIGRRAVLGASLFAAGSSCAQGGSALTPASLNARMTGDLTPVHDPCIIRQGDFYYVFSTTGSSQRDGGGLIPCRRSRDLTAWEKTGFVFDALPDWAQNAIPGASGLWAPDISRADDTYRLYYSVSTFGSNRSAIGLAVNHTLDPASRDYQWRDEGVVIESHRDDRFNAIDPNLLVDHEGKHWLSWGSFWSGLKLTRIDPATGKRDAAENEIHALASRPQRPGAVEAPFLIARGEFYYLFASFDFCCRGTNSTYYVVCGRSRDVAGPYFDREGRSMMEGGGSAVIEANARFKGPGHNAVLRESDRDYLVYHAYDSERDGAPTLRISPIHWTHDGWPRAEL